MVTRRALEALQIDYSHIPLPRLIVSFPAQSLQVILAQYTEALRINLVVSLDSFDSMLLEFNSIFRGGTGLVTVEDILWCKISSFLLFMNSFNCFVDAGGL